MLVYSLVQNDIPKALIAGSVSFGFSLMPSFGKSFFEKLTAALKQLGDKAGDVAVEEMGKKAKLALSRGFEQQYLEALKVQCDRIELEGFQNLKPLALDKVYVPLRIKSQDQQTLEGQRGIWDFLPRRDQTPEQSVHRRMAILAAPGYGKTTLMRHLTRTYATESPERTPPFIPVLLRFREIYKLLRSSSNSSQPSDNPRFVSLADLIEQHIPSQQGCKKLKPSKHWFEKALHDGKCLILFDGLDEVPKKQQRAVRSWVDAQMKEYRNTQFILTSRPHGFDLNPDEPSDLIEVETRLEVLKFNPQQKQDFIENWYRALHERSWKSNQLERLNAPVKQQLDPAQVSEQIADQVASDVADLTKQLFADQQLIEIADNPLMLTLIANTHQANTSLPKYRVDLYGQICDLFLGLRPHDKGTLLSLRATENKALLQLVAWQLQLQGKRISNAIDSWVLGFDWVLVGLPPKPSAYKHHP